MFKNIASIFNALKPGESLLHAETWKNVQVATNALAIVLTCVMVFAPQLGLTADDVQNLAAGIALVGGVVNGYFTIATTKKIGIGSPVVESDEQLPDVAVATPPVNVPAINSIDGGKNLLSGK